MSLGSKWQQYIKDLVDESGFQVATIFMFAVLCMSWTSLRQSPHVVSTPSLLA